MEYSSTLDGMPEEIILHTLSFLRPEDLCQVSQVSKKMYVLSVDDMLWKKVSNIWVDSALKSMEPVEFGKSFRLKFVAHINEILNIAQNIFPNAIQRIQNGSQNPISAMQGYSDLQFFLHQNQFNDNILQATILEQSLKTILKKSLLDESDIKALKFLLEYIEDKDVLLMGFYFAISKIFINYESDKEIMQREWDQNTFQILKIYLKAFSRFESQIKVEKSFRTLEWYTEISLKLSLDDRSYLNELVNKSSILDLFEVFHNLCFTFEERLEIDNLLIKLDSKPNYKDFDSLLSFFDNSVRFIYDFFDEQPQIRSKTLLKNLKLYIQSSENFNKEWVYFIHFIYKYDYDNEFKNILLKNILTRLFNEFEPVDIQYQDVLNTFKFISNMTEVKLPPVELFFPFIEHIFYNFSYLNESKTIKILKFMLKVYPDEDKPDFMKLRSYIREILASSDFPEEKRKRILFLFKAKKFDNSLFYDETDKNKRQRVF